MAKISLDLLKGYLIGRPEDAAPSRAVAFIPPTDAVSRLECSLPVVATLLVVANLDLAIEGFPDRIPFPSPGRNSRLLAVKRGEDGIWRLDGTPAAIKAAEDEGLFQPERLIVIQSVLKALGLHRTGNAIHRLAEFGGWDGDPIHLALKVQAAAAILPAHVMQASLGLCESLLPALDVENGDEEIEHWVGGVLALGIDPNVPPHADVPPATVRCAETMRSETLHALMRVGGDIEARSKDGLTPLLGAVRHAGYYGIKPVVEWNADPNATSNDGSGALHHAASNLTKPRTRELRETVRLLLSLGCDPHARDGSDRTPADLLRAWIDSPDAADDETASVGMASHLAEYLDGLAVSPRP